MTFGTQLEAAFSAESRGIAFSEIQQFRALIRSFGRIPEPFHVEEYHGNRHQVYFNGHGAWARTPALCELCDVLFVAYSMTAGFQARITFLQAKLSKRNHPTLCQGGMYIDPVIFDANLEQWDLLARRPDVIPRRPFDCPGELLRSALIPSVGSFGVFHRASRGRTGFFYASADRLSVAGAPTTRYGRLQTQTGVERLRHVAGLPDMTYCCCLPVFGDALHGLQIGTPIHSGGSVNAGDDDYRDRMRSWLGGILSAHVGTTTSESPLAQELLSALEVPRTLSAEHDSLPAVVVVRSDDQPAL